MCQLVVELSEVFEQEWKKVEELGKVTKDQKKSIEKHIIGKDYSKA